MIREGQIRTLLVPWGLMTIHFLSRQLNPSSARRIHQRPGSHVNEHIQFVERREIVDFAKHYHSPTERQTTNKSIISCTPQIFHLWNHPKRQLHLTLSNMCSLTNLSSKKPPIVKGFLISFVQECKKYWITGVRFYFYVMLDFLYDGCGLSCAWVVVIR